MASDAEKNSDTLFKMYFHSVVLSYYKERLDSQISPNGTVNAKATRYKNGSGRGILSHLSKLTPTTARGKRRKAKNAERKESTKDSFEVKDKRDM